MTRDEAEEAFRTLDPSIARTALEFTDQVPSAPTAKKASYTVDARPVLVAAIVPHPGGRPEVRITERRFASRRVWSWPSGQVHQGEQATDAVLRELNEELHLQDARVIRELGEVDTNDDVSPSTGARGSDADTA
jgi:8-oxo-dGTP pyrophosphatase MutT (NUDIX family)